MAVITVDQFINAIAGQESGGDYTRVNRDSGALGKYQIMPANVGPWSRQYLGYAISPSQFLNSRVLQDRLATAVLTSYFNRYGARGAAAAWYSGNPNKAGNYNPVPGGPSIGGYVDQVLERASHMPGSLTVSQLAADPVTTPAVPDVPGVGTETPPPPGGAAAGLGQMLGLETPSADEGQMLGLNTPTTDSSQTSMTSPGTTPAASPDTSMDPTAAQNAADAGASALANVRLNTKGVSSALRNGVVQETMKYLGVPYLYGGATPAGFDCSGLLEYSFAKLGLQLPRVSNLQLASGIPAALSELQPGDLVGFGSGGHVALYLGNGQILEAPHTSGYVRVRKLGANENAWGISLANLYK